MHSNFILTHTHWEDGLGKYLQFWGLICSLSAHYYETILGGKDIKLIELHNKIPFSP